MRSFRSPPLLLAFLLALPLLTTACATPRSLSLETAEADPWEAGNRRIYAFNKRADRYFMQPVANGYRAVVPQPGRRVISSAYNSYAQPRYVMNYLLQGQVGLAFESLDRLLLNVTLGVGGLSDVATDLGRPNNPTDFGQTFSQWNIAAGPYVMLPFLGPSTLRDSVATPFDFVVDPADIARNIALNPRLVWRGVQLTGRIVETRARLTEAGADGLLASSLDEYATVRSLFLQSRRAQLFYGNPPLSAEELEDYGETPTPASQPDAPIP
jgi:phospholipid-binding lipoprotein MlaA